MSTPHPDWNRLIAAARRAPEDTRDAAAPHGFAARLIAALRAAESAEQDASLFQRYALRALGVSCVLAIVCVAASVKPIMAAIEDETVALSETSTESEMTDLS